MSLRANLTVAVAAAVAVGIIAASVTAWLLIRSSMLAEVDEQLLARVPQADQIAVLSRALPARDPDQQRLLTLVQGEPVGLLLIDPEGQIQRQATFGPVTEALEDSGLLPAVSGDEPRLDTISVDGVSYRVLSAQVGEDEAVLRLFQPLSGIEATSERAAWQLTVVAVAGVCLAVAVGWVTSRAALRPVDRLVTATETVARTKDLASRIVVEPRRRDEIARLATSVNSMLAALETARGEQRELIENASHELRTPLTVLRNDFGLLARAEESQDRSLSAEERMTLLRDIDAQVAALGVEVGEIVDLARGEAEPEPVQQSDLLAIVERAVQRTRRVNPTVAVVVTGKKTQAHVRPDTLERAVANLVRNAIQASPDHGEVDVALSRDPWAFHVVVRDRGPGLDQDEIPHLFDRFYRGTKARSRHGSGLGLAIVAQAVSLHGGSVRAANRPGGGASFTMRWPVVRAS